jgi:hypothetical protein
VYQPLSWNRRTYVNNSPTNFSDPTGMAAQAANDPGLSESPAQAAERHSSELDAQAGHLMQWQGGTGTGQPAGAPSGSDAGFVLLGGLRRVSAALRAAKLFEEAAAENEAKIINPDCMSCAAIERPGAGARKLNTMWARYRYFSSFPSPDMMDGNGNLIWNSFAEFVVWWEMGGGAAVDAAVNDPTPLVVGVAGGMVAGAVAGRVAGRTSAKGAESARAAVKAYQAGDSAEEAANEAPLVARSVGASAKITVDSAIKESRYAVKLAEEMGEGAQRDVNHLIDALRNGNTNPGMGTKALGNGFFELRGGNAGRVIIYQHDAGHFTIVGKFQGHTLGRQGHQQILDRLMSESRFGR